MVPQRGGAPTIVVRSAEGGGETEDERRKKIMAMQNEIAEDILMASEEEREALQAKVCLYILLCTCHFVGGIRSDDDDHVWIYK